MKKFYYSIRSEKEWSESEQFEIVLDDWAEFMIFCNALSISLKKEIRACETKGYNNQGTYILAKF